jgi:hypothetical protein
VWGLGYSNYSVPFPHIAKNYDVVFVVDNYDRTGWVPDLSSDKQLKIHWAIDCHCGRAPIYLDFCRRSKINTHLNSSEQYMFHFAGVCERSYWFPNAYPDDLVMAKPEIGKTVDIGFCGTLSADRPQWTSTLEQRYGSRFRKDIFVIGDEMVNAVNSYKIAVNKSIADDLNYRICETLGAQTFLITNLVPNIERLFKDHEPCVFYSSPEEMLTKIDYFLEHGAEAQEIAARGHAHVRVSHTYLKRAQQLLDIIG